MEQNWAAVLVALQIPTDFLFLLPKGLFYCFLYYIVRIAFVVVLLGLFFNRLVQSVFKLETSMRPGKIGGCSVIILNFFQFR